MDTVWLVAAAAFFCGSHLLIRLFASLQVEESPWIGS